MARKPNYRQDRAERTRSKAAKKQSKLEAKAARRIVGGDALATTTDEHDAESAETSEGNDGFERAGKEEG